MRLNAQRRTLGSLLFVLLAVAVVPGLAAAKDRPWADPLTVVSGTDVTLYEATENMRGIGLIGQLLREGVVFPRFREATSQLFGVARRGSPLCPEALVPEGSNCTVNATGTDSVDLVTGRGSLGGSFTVVEQAPGEPTVDSPERVVMKGSFTGTIDFTPIFQHELPFGTAAGQMVLDGGGTFRFTGTFRQPVGSTAEAFYYTGSGVPPLNPRKDLTPVNANEYSLSYPSVRFEITFQPL